MKASNVCHSRHHDRLHLNGRNGSFGVFDRDGHTRVILDALFHVQPLTGQERCTHSDPSASEV